MSSPRAKQRKRRRLRQPALVVGLTGSVAMGKSTTAMLFKRLGVPVFEADAVVHRLLGSKGRALKAVDKRFPGVVSAAGVDRKRLGGEVFANPKALADLEAIIHPLVRAERVAFLKRFAHRKVVVLDIPLLFEGHNEDACDVIAVMSAPAFLQHQRALARPGMNIAKFKAILARQWPDAKKRAHADVVIPSGLGKRETLRRLTQFLTLARGKKSVIFHA